jgi:hypothetical protein
MNRSGAFVLWLIPLLFLLISMSGQGLVEGVGFWFIIVVIFLFAARSLGLTGGCHDEKEKPPESRSREEIEELERVMEPYLDVRNRRSKWREYRIRRQSANRPRCHSLRT